MHLRIQTALSMDECGGQGSGSPEKLIVFQTAKSGTRIVVQLIHYVAVVLKVGIRRHLSLGLKSW